MTYNFLTRILPFEVGYFKNLRELYLSENILSGEIPVSFGNCISLVERLHLKEQFLHL
jgi:Leucine-rich repeat (LRR) protein